MPLPLSEKDIDHVEHVFLHEVLDILFGYEKTQIETTLRELVKNNNQFHGQHGMVGAILYKGKEYSTGLHADFVPHHPPAKEIEPDFLAWLKQNKRFSSERHNAKRLITMLFNTQPNYEQLYKAFGAQLMQRVMTNTIIHSARVNITAHYQKRSASKSFNKFFETNKEYFHNLQERVIRNMLLKK